MQNLVPGAADIRAAPERLAAVWARRVFDPQFATPDPYNLAAFALAAFAVSAHHTHSVSYTLKLSRETFDGVANFDAVQP